MLPTKIKTINYQEISLLIDKEFEQIQNYTKIHKLNFDFVFAKSKNAMIPGTIISNKLSIPCFSFIYPRESSIEDIELLIPKNIDKKKKYNALLVFNILYDEEQIKIIKEFFKSKYSNIKIHILTLFSNIKLSYDLCLLTSNVFFQTPWELHSLTPEASLDRLLLDKKITNEENYNYIGLCDDNCKELLEQSFLFNINKSRIAIFDNNIALSSSLVSNLDLHNNLTMLDFQNKYNKIIQSKNDMILKYGLTHFIETNIFQAILLAEKNSVCKILYFDEKKLHHIYSFECKSEEFKNLLN